MEAVKNNDQNASWEDFIRDGNMDALSRVYFQFYDQLLSYGLKHTSDQQAVEDSIQNTFLNLIKSRKNIGHVKNLTGYLLVSFRRQLFQFTSNQKNTILSEKLNDENFDYFKSSDSDKLENENMELMLSVIEESMESMSSRQREILFLKFYSGISYEEIAQMLNISVDSCYKSVYRSIKALKKIVEKIKIPNDGLILLFFPAFKIYMNKLLNNS